jgi:uncharacterized protein YjiS (DUF1127 family)
MTIITSPIAPDMTRRPTGPSALGALIEAIRRLIGRKRAAIRDRAAMRKLLEADEAVLRDIGVDRAEVARRFRGAVEARPDLRWG